MSIEEIRIQYRNEALKAIENAKKEKDDVIKALEDEIKKLKGLVDYTTSEGEDNKLLLKYVMEQVYRDIKKEWGNNEQDIINKMKNILITSTEILTSKLPKLYINKENNNMPTLPASNNNTQIVEIINKLPISTSSTTIQRSDHLQVKNKPILFDSYIKINITKCFNQTVKGVVINGSVTYYSIETSIYIDEAPPRQFEQNRRYSEFQALYQLLIKKYAHIFIPSLPKIDDALIENGLASKRKRQLCIWLQYIVLHGDLQKSNDIAKFLSQGQYESYISIFNHALSNASKKPVAKKLSPVETQIKFREICTVISDINQLSYHSANVTKSNKILIKSIVDHAKTLANVGNYMKNITERSDNSNTKEYRLWTVTGMLITEIYPHLVAVGQILLANIYENVSFLGNECFQTANNICEISNGIIGSMKINEEEKIIIVNNVSSEWATYRYLRKIIMQQHIERTLVDIADQYKEIMTKLNIACDEINQFIVNGTDGEKVSVDTEYSELKHILDSEIDELEALVLNNKGIQRYSSYQSEKYIPPLHHDNLDRPVLPSGVRKEPSKVVLDDTYITSNEEITSYNRLSLPNNTSTNRLRAVTPTHDEDVSITTHEASDTHKSSSWKNYFKPTLGVANKGLNKDLDNDNDRKSNHAFDKLWNILLKPKRNSQTENQGSGSDSSDNEGPLGASSYSDPEEDTPMNIAYSKKAKDMLEAQEQDIRQRNEVMEEIFERKRNRRGKAPTGQGSGSGVARRPKAKVNNGKDDIYASTVKPAEAVLGFAYSGSTHDYLASSIPSVNAPSIPVRPVPRTRTGSDSNVASSNNRSDSDIHDNRQQSSSVPKSIDIPDLPVPPMSTASTNDTNSNSDLPPGWEEVHGDNGSIYYYHKFTRLSRWDKPDAAVAASIEANVRDQQDKMNELNRKRKEEIEQKKQQQELREKTADQLKAKIKVKIEKWKGVTNNSTVTNHIADLLTTLPSILNFIPINTVTTTPLNSASSQADIKKAYLKAIRLVHPDKLSSDLDLENQLLAQACFIIINETYDKYRESVQ